MKFDQPELAAFVLTVAKSVIALIQKELQRNLERVVDLCPLNVEINQIPNQPNDGGDSKTGDRGHRSEVADDVNELGFDADLLVGFPESCSAYIFVVRLHPPPGKADLPCVVLEISGALRQ
jgi:hypothetical protein